MFASCIKWISKNTTPVFFAAASLCSYFCATSLIAQESNQTEDLEDSATASDSSAPIAIDDPHLDIQLITPFEGDDPEAAGLEFGKVCEKFAKHLLKNAGYWGTGPFMATNCSPPTKSKSQWVLQIRVEKSEVIFEISFRGEKLMTAAMLTLTTSKSPLTLMNDRQMGPLIAFYLATDLPMRSLVSKSKFASGQTVTGRAFTPPIRAAQPPKQLAFFDMSYERGSWRPHVMAVAKLKSATATDVTWQVSDVSEKPTKKVSFVQQIDDRKPLLAAIKAQIETFSSRFKFAPVRAGYIGMRYGIPITSGAGPFKVASTYGLLGEFRSGFLSGVRISYDAVPKSVVQTETGVESYESSRLQLGYSFGTTLPTPLINWIDVTPRIGVTNLEYSLVPADLDLESEVAFTLRRAPTTGLELGLETRGHSFLIRAWAYGSYSIGILAYDKQFSSRMVRLGLDLYRDVFSLGPMRFGVLGFTSYEDTSVARKIVEDDPDVAVIETIGFSVIYAGAGLTLSW